MASFKVGATDNAADPICFNALRFATKEEADNYASDLMWRWLACVRTETVESDDEPNYTFVDRKLERIDSPPKGVTIVSLNDAQAVHDTIAEAIGESEQ